MWFPSVSHCPIEAEQAKTAMKNMMRVIAKLQDALNVRIDHLQWISGKCYVLVISEVS